MKQTTSLLTAVCTAQSGDVTHMLPSVCVVITSLIKYPVPAVHLSPLLTDVMIAALGDQLFGELACII